MDEYVDDSTPLSQYSFDNLKTREEAAAQAAAINAAINAGETPSSGDAAAATTGSAVSSADAAAAVSGISGVSGSAIDCSI